MNKEELHKLKEQLLEEKKLIEEQLKPISVENPAIAGDREPVMPNYGDDYDDSINESTDLDRNFALHQELETRLEHLKDTLSKIDQGTYGECSDCATPIAFDRLKAIPTATLCMNCAQKQQ